MTIPTRYLRVLQAFTLPLASGQRVVKWTEFHRTFKNHFEFDVQRGGNAKHTFTPPSDSANGRWSFGSKTFVVYKPDNKEFTPLEMKRLRKTFQDAYGWGPETFSRC